MALKFVNVFSQIFILSEPLPNEWFPQDSTMFRIFAKLFSTVSYSLTKQSYRKEYSLTIFVVTTESQNEKSKSQYESKINTQNAMIDPNMVEPENARIIHQQYYCPDKPENTGW
jgi:hypothetical protein